MPEITEYKEKINKELKRCKELLELYKSIPNGFFGASIGENGRFG